MNSIKYVITCFFFLTLFACHNQSKNNNFPPIRQETNNDLYDKPVEDEKAILTKKEIKDISHLTKEDINELENKSKIGSMIIYEIGRTMGIISDGELTNSLLGKDLSDIGIQNRFRHIFTIEHQEISNASYPTPQKISKFVFNQSFLKIYYDNEVGQYVIAPGRIKNEEIFMPFNICIGISRKNFFDRIFNDANQYEFSTVDTLSNGDEMGEIHQDFIFKNDALKEVIIKSVCDWIPFD